MRRGGQGRFCEEFMLFYKGRVPSIKRETLVFSGSGSFYRGFREICRLKIVEHINPDNPILCLKVPFLPNQSLDFGISDLTGI